MAGGVKFYGISFSHAEGGHTKFLGSFNAGA